MAGLWDQFIRRMSLMDDMFVRTGAIRKGDAAPPAMRDAVERCAGCTAETECSHWLETAEQGSRPPDFCPNSELIARLRVIGDATMN